MAESPDHSHTSLMLESGTSIAFQGKIRNGLKVHPDGQNLVYSIGNTIIIEDMSTKQQDLLKGHTMEVTCIAISKSGKYIASGQVIYMGFTAPVIIWNYENRSQHCTLELHKVKVEDLAFSPNDLYLASLGGQDDGSIVIWNILKGEPICGSQAQVMSAGTSHCVTFANKNDEKFITGGDQTLRVWELDVRNRKIRPTEVNMGQLKRVIKCIQMADDDKYFYCGTTTGDILGINSTSCLFQFIGPQKNQFSQGVTSIALLKTGEILVGAGDGTVQKVKKVEKGSTLSIKRIGPETKLTGAITSLALRGKGHQFFVGTSKCDIYKFNLLEFTHELLATCHCSPVNDIIFPSQCSDLFITCSKEDIRVWETSTNKELLRITVPNKECLAIELMKNGNSIISAWDDGIIRFFSPEKGSLMHEIKDAHNKGVTALAVTSDSRMLISGGGEGQVRVWSIDMTSTSKGPTWKTSLKSAMKEHKAKVTCIKLKCCNTECISASEDGTCIIWNLETFVRSQVIFSNTLFRCVCYGPDETQLIGSGTDRKIGYWGTHDSSQIRELEGTVNGAINGMDISLDKKYIVTGGEDKIIKVWDYHRGEVLAVGLGHSGTILRTKISPDAAYIVSVSSDGAILKWKFPNCCHS